MINRNSLVVKPKQELDAQSEHQNVKRQTRNLRHCWEWTEESIWSEKMLTALENGVKGGKWFSLIDKVYTRNTLELAWKVVKRNKGAAGVDGVDIEKFGRKKDLYLTELHEGIKAGSYQPKAVKRVYIPKGNGKLRPLGIPTVKDRIVQAAIKLVIEPIFEKEFMSCSYGFRPRRGCKDALRRVDELLKEGRTWYADADMQAYFDTIPHQLLMQKFKRYISDGALCTLVDRFLRHEIMEEGEARIAEAGTPQGGVLSPLLANLYLHDLDVLLTTKGLEMVRYADDFIVLTKSQEEAKRAKELVHEWVEANGLIIHPEKSHTGNCMIEGEGFEFLGYRFEAGTRWVRPKSLKNFRDKIREKTSRSCGKSLGSVIKELNPLLKGWYEYFKHVTKYTMESFDSFVRRRLRAILRKQNKRPGFGRSLRDHTEWPNAYFANLGLFSMEQARCQDSACQSRC